MAKPNAALADESARLRDILRGAGLRSTQPRIAVYKQLLGAAAPVTHGDVAEVLGGQGFDRATVYRNLIDLCDAGLAQRTDHGDHLWRFELLSKQARDHDATAHAHFVCTDCGTIECLPATAVRFTRSPHVPRSVEDKRVEIQLKGVCDTCAT